MTIDRQANEIKIENERLIEISDDYVDLDQQQNEQQLDDVLVVLDVDSNACREVTKVKT